MRALARSISRSAKLVRSPGFPENRTGSIHELRSHDARSTSQLPARSLRPHCASRPYSKVDLQLQFPGTKLSTSGVGRPRHEIVAVDSVARGTGINLTARSSVRELHFHPVARIETARSARGTRTAEPPRRSVSRAVKPPQLHGSPGRRNQHRRSGCPKHRRSLRRTGRSSVLELVLAIRLPGRRSRPQCADPE